MAFGLITQIYGKISTMANGEKTNTFERKSKMKFKN